METGNATLNQKVFITLRAYTALVNEYHRTIQERDSCAKSGQTLSQQRWHARKEAFDYFFRECELPIPKLT